MENKLKIVEWNINKRSKSTPINPIILEVLQEEDAAINILVEYKKDKEFEKKLSNNYAIFAATKEKRNDVLIAISEKYTSNSFDDIGPNPNRLDFLSVQVEVNHEKICVIAIRILPDKNTKPDYDERAVVQEELRNYVNSIKSKFDHIIIAGDFNHAQVYSDKELYGIQKPCSYHKLSERFNDIGFTLSSPIGYDTNSPKDPNYINIDINKNSYSWVGEHNYGNFYIALDHIIVNKDIKVSEIKYDWNFLEKIGQKDKKSKFKSDQEAYPDHAMLSATIEF